MVSRRSIRQFKSPSRAVAVGFFAPDVGAPVDRRGDMHD
jgi:hypothetical protein